MSEWLTTGQMIDQLKVGERAECKAWETWVTRTNSGFWESDSMGCLKNRLKIDNEVLETTWRIIPQYVSFEEAMKALQEGKIVNVFMDGKKYRFKAENPYILEELGGYSFKNLFEAKWTVDK